MNPVSNLIGKKFNELTACELMQTIMAYCDQNNYDFDYNLEYKNIKDVKYYFESNFYGFYELECFFNYWTI